MLFNRENFGKSFVSPDLEAEPLGELVSSTRILLDLVQYHDPRLTEAGLKLLLMHFNQKTSFVREALQVHLVVRPTTARVFYRLRCEIAEMRAWTPYLDEDDHARKKEALVTCGKLIARWTSVLAGRGDKDKGGMDVKEAQAMVINLEMHTAIMRILSLQLARQLARRVGELDTAIDWDRRELMQSCHQLIQKMCKGNEHIQRIFYEQWDTLAHQMGIAGLDVEHTMAAIVQGNHELCHEAGPEWIPMIFQTMTHYRARRARWLDTLMPLVCPDGPLGRGIKEHQGMVMRHLAHRKEDVLLLMSEPTEWDLRIDLALADERSVKGSSSQLSYHISCVRLLALCARGNNPGVEAQVMSLLPFDTAMDSILNVDVRRFAREGIAEALPIATARAIKGAFVSVLKEVYMDNSSPDARQAVLRPGNCLWPQPKEGLESSAGAKGAMEDLMTVVLEDAKELLVALEYQAKGHAIEQEAEFKSLIAFVMQDCVPMLESYYRNHYVPRSVTHDGSDVEHTEQLFDALSGCLPLMDSFLEHKPAVSRLLSAIGEKVGSREAQIKLLEFHAVDTDGMVDAPSLLRDLMRVGFSVLVSQLGDAIKLPSPDMLATHGGILNLAMMLARDKRMPLFQDAATNSPQVRLSSWSSFSFF